MLLTSVDSASLKYFASPVNSKRCRQSWTQVGGVEAALSGTSSTTVTAVLGTEEEYKEMLIDYLERFIGELVLVTSDVAEPSRPARPVRPMRCMYVSGISGKSKLITCDTPGMCRPRAATSVATSTGISPS